jgi:exodeoxyribonuclease-3
VRIATWNCCGQYDENLRHLLDEDTDLAVVCEAAARSGWPIHQGREVTGWSQRVWSESYRELAVVGRSPYSVVRHPQAGSAPAWLLPTTVDGPVPFTLIGVWTVVYGGSLGYVRQLERAADWLEKARLSEPVVLAGDFNAPISTSQAQYDAVARRLRDLGLVDAYRASRGLGDDENWTEATYYQYRRQDRPFHIDHLFVPAEWADRVKVEVGDFDTWVGSGRSDHVPLIADFGDIGN